MSKLSEAREKFIDFLETAEEIKIPTAVLRDTRINFKTMYVYGYLFTKSNSDITKHGIYYGNSSNIADTLGLSPLTVRRIIKKLHKLGYIEKNEDIDFPSQMRSKGLSGLGEGGRICQWCEIKTNVIDDHHFPIPKALKGVETVSICPNCHAEYHRNDVAIRVLRGDVQ